MLTKKLAMLLLTILFVLTSTMAIACTPLGPDPDFSAMGSSSSVVDPPIDEPIAEILESIPNSPLVITATVEGVTATSTWHANLTEDGVNFTVYVEDADLHKGSGLFNGDGVELRISKEQNEKGISADAISVIVTYSGQVATKVISTNEESDLGVVAEVTEFTFENETIDGYYVEISVPATALDFIGSSDNMAICAGVMNAIDSVTCVSSFETSYGSKRDSEHTWIAVTGNNQFEENEFLREAIDVLFIGDSYISTQFWNPEETYNKMMAYYGVNAVNLGESGSQIDRWMDNLEDLSFSYAPESIVAHIGVNDIDDANQTAEQTYEELVEMFEAYHEAFPTSKLYWVSLIPNAVFTAKLETYKQVNVLFETYANTKDWANYINEWDAFCSKEVEEGVIAPRYSMFMRNTDGSLEGMHLNVEFGYPLWAGIIMDALGYEKEHGDAMGDNVAGNLYASIDWDLSPEDENDAISNGIAEKAAWFTNAYSADIYFEADVYTPSAIQHDQWPKVGLTLKSDKAQVFAYFDLPIVGDTNIVYRPSTAAGQHADWMWNGGQAGVKNCGKNIEQGYVNVGIAKLGNVVYMLIDGEVINSMTVPGMSENTKVVAGVMGFNQKILVKNAMGTGVSSEVEYKLLPERSITVQKDDNTTVELNREIAKKGDVITFTVNSTDAPISAVKVYGEELVADNGTYSFTMKDENAIILVEYVGKLSVTLEGCGDKVIASTIAPYIGSTVTFTASETASIIKLFANDEELVAEEGVYSVVANENLVITGEFYNKYNGVVMDGILDEAYGETYTLAEYERGITLKVYAVKVERGVLLYTVANLTALKSGRAEWWLNTNFEFQLNAGGQSYVTVDNTSHNVNDYKWITKTPEQTGTSLYEYTVEIFVDNSSIIGWSNDGEVQLNYAWKNDGEQAGPIGDITFYDMHYWNTYDWYTAHIGGLKAIAFYPEIAISTSIGTMGKFADNLRITTEGLKIGEDPTWATVDGNLEEYAGLSSVTNSNDKTTATLTGKAADDGLYIALTIVHSEKSTWKQGDFWANDNIEIHINDATMGFADDSRPGTLIFNNGKLCRTAFWDKAEAITVKEGDKYVTTVELYVAVEHATVNDAYAIRVGINGQGFGWVGVQWDNNAYITANGLVAARPEYNSDAVLDGVLDDAIWTEEVKSKVHSTNAQGSNISVIGVSGTHGIHVAITFTHSINILSKCREQGADYNDWWHYMGPEIRVGGAAGLQIAASPWNNWCNNCSFGYTTTGEEGSYVTTFEMFIPYDVTNGCRSSVGIAFGGNWNNGFAHLWAENTHLEGVVTHYVTPNGIVVA